MTNGLLDIPAQTRKAKHSAATDEHYTPSEILDASRDTMGDIDLDPASCRAANRIVMARKYFDNSLIRNGVYRPRAVDGLNAEWTDITGHKGGLRVFLNPPGGKLGNQSIPKLFWERLCDEYDSGNVAKAIFVAFSIEMLQTTQSSPRPISDFMICIPKQRLRFIGAEGKPGSSPTHANAIVYLGSDFMGFARKFRSVGQILRGFN